MKYQNTRGGCSGISFEETLFVGWHHQGGLLVPEHIPKLSNEELLSWSSLSYQQICMQMFELFTDEEFMSTYNMETVLKEAHSEFPPTVMPMRKIDDCSRVLELFNGPTHSFKDVALSVAGPLLNMVVQHRNKFGLIYVATTGDTGSAVINAAKHSSHLDVVTFLPGGSRITPLQRMLMTTVDSDNIHNFSADCACDEFDVFLPGFASELREKYPGAVVTSLNSLNWIRILVQACHLFHAYFQLAENMEEVSFVIPTGGGGHITSALLVRKMGLPIKIVAACNEKNLNFQKFLIGEQILFDKEVTKSLSCAMDIQIPTQVDRLIYFLSGGDVDLVRKHMDPFFKGERLQATGEVLANLRGAITTFITRDEDILKTMKRCWTDHQYLIDPHTASGFARYYDMPGGRQKTVFMGCASPIKFMDELELAGVPASDSYHSYFDQLKALKEKVNEMPLNREEWMSFMMKFIQENISHKWQ